ncbi:MAG: site-2 protease family protein [Chloroflexota bacterium]
MLDLSPVTLITRLVSLVIALTIHEFAHAWTADHFGDPTPRQTGRLTLNPLAHLDFLGSLLILVSGFGWARPVMVNTYALRRHSSAALMWVALAGPLSNLGLAILGAIPFRSGLVSLPITTGSFLPSPGYLLLEFGFLNIILAIFNLIPLAPLDGEKVFSYLAPPNLTPTLDKIRPFGPLILLGVVFLGPYLGLDILGWIVWRPAFFLHNLLIG